MKPVSIYFLSVALAGLLTIGCLSNSDTSAGTSGDHAAAFDLTAMRKVIDAKNNQFTNAHVINDSAAIVDFFTADARIYAPGANAVSGRPAIAVLVGEYQKYGIKSFQEETTALYGNEEYLINEGTYVMSYGNDNTMEKGKFLNVWKKVNDDWKIYTNMWNTNAPEAPVK